MASSTLMQNEAQSAVDEILNEALEVLKTRALTSKTVQMALEQIQVKENLPSLQKKIAVARTESSQHARGKFSKKNFTRSLSQPEPANTTTSEAEITQF